MLNNCHLDKFLPSILIYQLKQKQLQTNIQLFLVILLYVILTILINTQYEKWLLQLSIIMFDKFYATPLN